MQFPVELSKKVSDVKGDIIEFGVLAGETFVRLARENKHKTCHAVDSFVGFRRETHPKDDQTKYPPGRWNQGGPDALYRAMRNFHIRNACVHQGFVPRILDSVEDRLGDAEISFAHLDMDLYTPTLCALKWLYPRIAHGGIIACHDYFDAGVESTKNVSAAVNDFFKECGMVKSLEQFAIHQSTKDEEERGVNKGVWCWWVF
jgi:hypothetical protein